MTLSLPPLQQRVTTTPVRICTLLADALPSRDRDATEDLFVFLADNGYEDCGTSADYDLLMETYLRMGTPFTVQRFPAHIPDPTADEPHGLSALTASERNPYLAHAS